MTDLNTVWRGEGALSLEDARQQSREPVDERRVGRP